MATDPLALPAGDFLVDIGRATRPRYAGPVHARPVAGVERLLHLRWHEHGGGVARHRARARARRLRTDHRDGACTSDRSAMVLSRSTCACCATDARPRRPWPSYAARITTVPALHLTATFGTPDREPDRLRRCHVPRRARPRAVRSSAATARPTHRSNDLNFHQQTDWRPTSWWDPETWTSQPAETSCWTRFVKEPRLADGTIDPISLPIPADMLGPAVGQRIGPQPVLRAHPRAERALLRDHHLALGTAARRLTAGGQRLRERPCVPVGRGSSPARLRDAARPHAPTRTGRTTRSEVIGAGHRVSAPATWCRVPAAGDHRERDGDVEGHRGRVG